VYLTNDARQFRDFRVIPENIGKYGAQCSDACSVTLVLVSAGAYLVGYEEGDFKVRLHRQLAN
jgi:hypothetical protein